METPGYFLDIVQSESPDLTVCILELATVVPDDFALLVFEVFFAIYGFLG